ncbi:MAG TPA: gamma-glutamyl-gamma-aminobutyrate hydrolase family protein [Actinomycetota bacterium]
MRALVVMHDRLSLPGLIGERAEERGFELVGHVPAEDGPLPAPEAFDAVIPMGSPWSVYGPEVAGWIEDELGLLRLAVERDVPVFGVCFGAQAFAKAMGGEVRKGDVAEVGFHEVRTDAPDVVPPGPWFMWHGDTFTPPPGARVLATTDAGPQAYAFGRHLLVHFHPEVREDIVRMWLGKDVEAPQRYGFDADELLADIRARSDGSRARAAALFDRFLDG